MNMRNKSPDNINPMIDPKGLRRIYGRSLDGVRNRTDIKISLTPETMNFMRQFVELGKGKYGSALVELAIRFACVMLSEGTDSDIRLVGSELLQGTNSPYLVNNLRALATFIENRD
jgi:hypothetical protein